MSTKKAAIATVMAPAGAAADIRPNRLFPSGHPHPVLSFDQIRENLAGHPLPALRLDGRKHAAVAMLLRDSGGLPEVLLIQRAINPRDVWSGHLALPGGRVEAHDPSAKDAAERETREEVGISLEAARFLGQLPEVVPIDRPIVVSCFVYGLAETPEVRPDHREVARTLWFMPHAFGDASYHSQVQIVRRGRQHTFPALALPGIDQPLWGITYKLIEAFHERTSAQAC